MQLQPVQSENGVIDPVLPESHFIEANTMPVALNEIKDFHIIPVFVKDNTPTISQADFIETAMETASKVFNRSITSPKIRVSHPIKGRVFEARNKKAAELEEWEKTIYYERMAFVAEMPSFKETIHGQELTLTIGGVKAYNQDNLYNQGNSPQKFRFFVGFKVKVCTNLCVWTDGFSGELKVRNLHDLGQAISEVLENYSEDRQLELLDRLGRYELSEKQFATLLGRARMYQYLPKQQKAKIPQLLISDSQVATVARSYFTDEHFKGDYSGTLNLWNLYNLMTHAVKSSYIDTFLDRNVNALYPPSAPHLV